MHTAVEFHYKKEVKQQEGSTLKVKNGVPNNDENELYSDNAQAMSS